jgi:cytochrome b6-f complex iron-sulfur subunit
MTPTGHYLTRRSVLCAGGVGAAGVCAFVLTGCGSSASSTSKTTTSAAAPTTSAAAASTSAPATTAAPAATTAGATSSPAGEPEGTQVAKLSDVPVGGSSSASLNGKPIILAQPSAGKVVGFSAICTHQACTVNSGGATLHCPCHGSTYDAFTGQNAGGPAPRPLTAITVTVFNGAVFAHA